METVQKNEHVKGLSDAELKAKKAASAKAWKERKDKEAAERKETAAKLIEFLVDKKVELPAEFNVLLNSIANPTSGRAGGSAPNSLYAKMFGDTPKVGDKVTLMDAFKKTLKSKADIDRAVKTWAEKGIVVVYTAAQNMLESTYTIKSIK